MKETQASSDHWTQQKEKAAGYWVLKFCLILFRLLPVILLRVLAFPVGFFYFIFSKRTRAESGRFLKRVAAFTDNGKTAKKCRSCFGPLRHIISFSLNFVEKLQSWGGKFLFEGIHYQEDDVHELVDGMEKGKGAILIASHLGNIELLRGLVGLNRAGVHRNIPLTAIIDTEVTAHFSRMMKELNPQTVLDIITVDQIGPQTVALLEEKLSSGGMITITGDRTSSTGTSKNLLIPFLGEDAQFPYGPFYLASLLEVPIYFIFSLRQGELALKPEYNMHVHKYSAVPPSADTPPVEGGRKQRLKAVSAMVRYFAALMESYCKKEPFQWYNFFDFWQKEV